MRLGIRRKLIGTLMLVGLFPLVISLIVIMGGGAAMQLSGIRKTYIGMANDSATELTSRVRSELRHITYIARLPETQQFVREQNRMREDAGPIKRAAGTSIPEADGASLEMDRQWGGLSEKGPALVNILQNTLAKRLRLISEIDGQLRQMLVTNAAGELIAADTKSGDFFQADETWWKESFNGGLGQTYVSSLVIDPTTGKPCLELCVPIYDAEGGKGPMRVIGIIKDKLDVTWLTFAVYDMPKAMAGASGQLVDVDAGKTIYASETSAIVGESLEFFLAHRTNPHVSIPRLLLGDIILGSSLVEFDAESSPEFANAKLPHWAVLVSRSSSEAMIDIYRLAAIGALIGFALIVVLFILGIAISNREIIMPILRLREATAAVGRGELNVRLLSENLEDTTFRRDELGDLAKDFDEMTRQLQKNVNQLARSNEAKRRFMELAGHELRTPVTYILGVCQLAQRQLVQEVHELTVAAQQPVVGAKTTGTVGTALGKIAIKTLRLAHIIDNLLKLVGNDQFTTRLSKAPVDLRALVLQVTADYRPFLAERKQKLVLDVAENIPALDGDRDKLEDVLNNLLSNAIRFSPDGGVVRVALHKVVGDMVEILVEDSGPGIKEDELANLFEPFYTGTDILHHHSGEMEYGSKGLGLGLAVVRRFVELHGGVVRAHLISEGSRTGTQFQILLPVTREDMDTGARPMQAGG